MTKTDIARPRRKRSLAPIDRLLDVTMRILRGIQGDPIYKANWLKKGMAVTDGWVRLQDISRTIFSKKSIQKRIYGADGANKTQIQINSTFNSLFRAGNFAGLKRQKCGRLWEIRLADHNSNGNNSEDVEVVQSEEGHDVTSDDREGDDEHETVSLN